MARRDADGRRRLRLPRRSAERIRDDVREELEFHVAARAEALVRQGMTADRARAEAEREFGDLGATQAYCAGQDRAAERARRRAAWYRDAAGDLRLAVRGLRRRPLYLGLAVATLALGLAAVLAMSTVMQRLVLAPLPFPGGDRIVMLWRHPPGRGDALLLPSSDLVDAWRRRSTSLEAIEAIEPRSRALLRGAGPPASVPVAAFDERLFPLLHLTPDAGRAFIADDRRAGAPAVVMISHELWVRDFGGASDVPGRHIRLDDADYAIVGVAPAALRGIPALGVRVDVWVPSPGSGSAPMSAFALARLRPGVSPAAAERELSDILGTLTTTRDAAAATASVRTPAQMLGENRLLALRILWAASALLLLVAAVNYTHLLLARSAERTRELAVRSALGASRWRIARLSLVEALLLGAIAYLVHVPLSLLLLRVASLTRPDTLWMLDQVSLDGRVLVAGLLGTVILIVGCAMAATWGGTPRDFTPLRAGTASLSRPAHRLRRTLISAEVALACVLVVGAALLARSFVALVNRPAGFRASGALLVSMRRTTTAPPGAAEAQDAGWEAFARALEVQPGIVGVVHGLSMPPESGIEIGRLEIEGRPTMLDSSEQAFSASYVSPGFFRLAGIRLVAGAAFSPSGGTPDDAVIVSASMARRFWPGRDAVGARIRFTIDGSRQAAPPWLPVVGVVDDVLSNGLHTEEAGMLQIYHFWNRYGSTPEFLVRYRGASGTVRQQIRAVAQDVAPDAIVSHIESVDALLRESARSDRFYLMVLGVIAGLAASLAIAGVFGVVASITMQRTREIALRVALGSSPTGVYALVIGDGMRAVLVGLALGAGGAIGLGRLLRALLYGVTTHDPVAFLVAVVLIAAAAVGACVLPARRAARLQPAVVLRTE